MLSGSGVVSAGATLALFAIAAASAAGHAFIDFEGLGAELRGGLNGFNRFARVIHPGSSHVVRRRLSRLRNSACRHLA
jgi:hypothetical protein